VNSLGYAYPWDFDGDEEAAHRAASLGLDGVAIAAAYHTVRAATPLHPRHRLVRAEHAACYVPVREEAWKGRALRPAVPSWTSGSDGGDSFGHARDALRAAGLTVHAWTVLTHNSRLGAAHPGLTVRNAFGERYPYALCPAADEVAEYAALLVREVALLGAPDGLVVEACGPLGVTHGGHHDKTDLSGWTEHDRKLLSLCFCTACESRLRAAGLDPDHVSARVRAALTPGGSTSVDEALGADVAAAVGETRAGLTRELRVRVASAVREVEPGLRLTFHASADPWATGPFATVSGGLAVPADAVVGNCWQPGEPGERELAALRTAAGPDTRLGAYLLADGTWGDAEAVRERLGRYRAVGMDELHLYHLGLAGRDGHDLLRRLVATAGEL